MDAGQKVKAFLDFYNGFEAIIIEHTVFMNSPKTAADLALVQGAILGAAGQSGTKVIGRVSPITWQNYLGNKKMSKEDQALIRSAHPGKSVSWYKTYERNLRKERTITMVNTVYDRSINDNDVADACGIGHWALKNWDKAIGDNK
jgi:Holliday junction resolvasome RuvABC endonuclease subunit